MFSTVHSLPIWAGYNLHQALVRTEQSWTWHAFKICEPLSGQERPHHNHRKEGSTYPEWALDSGPPQPPSLLGAFSTLGIARGTLTPHKGYLSVPMKLYKSGCEHSETSTCLPNTTKNSSQQEALGKVDFSTSERLICLSHIRYNLCYRKLLQLAATPGRLAS